MRDSPNKTFSSRLLRSVGQGQAFEHDQPLAGRCVESGRLGAAGASAAAVAVLQGVLGRGPLEPSGPREHSVASRTSEQLAVHLGILLLAEGLDVVAVKVIPVAAHAARRRGGRGRLWLQDERNAVDVSDAGAALLATKLERSSLTLQGVAEDGREEVGRRWRDGGRAAEAQVEVEGGWRGRGAARGAQEAGEADALAELVAQSGRARHLLLLLVTRELGGTGQRPPAELVLMDEVAARAIGAVAKVVEGSARLRLVLGVAVESPQLRLAVGKLALAAVLAAARLLEAPAQLRLVAVGGGHGLHLGRQVGGGGEARRWGDTGGGGGGREGLQVLQLSEGGQQAAGGLGQAHGAVGPEGGGPGLGDGALAPDVGRPEGAAHVVVVDVLAAHVAAGVGGVGGGGRGEKGGRPVEPTVAWGGQLRHQGLIQGQVEEVL